LMTISSPSVSVSIFVLNLVPSTASCSSNGLLRYGSINWSVCGRHTSITQRLSPICNLTAYLAGRADTINIEAVDVAYCHLLCGTENASHLLSLDRFVVRLPRIMCDSDTANRPSRASLPSPLRHAIDQSAFRYNSFFQ
jgi:hypothetical protein